MATVQVEKATLLEHHELEMQRPAHKSANKTHIFKVLGLISGGLVILSLALCLCLGSGTNKSEESSSLLIARSKGINRMNHHTRSHTATRTSTVSATTTKTYWKPTAGTTWQYAISVAEPRVLPGISVYGIDLFDTSTATISSLHSSGHKVMCYFSAGSYEDWRPDASKFLPSDLGDDLDGWVGENWVDVSSANVRNIMVARLDLAVAKGCDGVDPDNVDGYGSTNGLGLTSAMAVDYLKYLATAAHSRGMSIGLKNAADIVASVVGFMDWEIDEQCEEYTECDLFQPFIAANKPVFHVEYSDDGPNTTEEEKKAICAFEGTTGFSTIIKKINTFIRVNIYF